MEINVYLICIAITIVLLAFVFLRKRKDEVSDYVEPTFKASGKKWVFNGILDIDAPPADLFPFADYEGSYQLMVKKGFVHYDLELSPDIDFSKHLGLFQAMVRKKDGFLLVEKGGVVVGGLSKGLQSLAASVSSKGGSTRAYGFIAQRGDTFFGEICVEK